MDPEVTPPALPGLSLEAMRQEIARRVPEMVEECGRELAALLARYNCALITEQRLINGMPEGPAKIVIIPR